ncbi:MAG TPA: alpha/beta fold hydrolase [Candidatus Acidoferrales bacterium]|nr:alpha/beta fold hydrolase [Candidatus Acidoferrales bacterium]
MDDVELGRFRAQHEQPEPVKFAWPIVVFPEFFCTPRHLAVLLGYLTTIGWEVYAPDLRAHVAGGGASLANFGFNDLIRLAAEALDAIGRDVVMLGHGVGGLAALKLGEHRRVKAAVAYAPLLPGARTPLTAGVANRIAALVRRPLAPPRGRTLFELIADSDAFTRDAIIKAMVPGSRALLDDVVRGEIEFRNPAAPRLIVAGDSDIFAPYDLSEKFAASIGASIAKLSGRGHWLVGGRALERAIGETQRFLVRALGQDLLLLYPEEWKNEGGGGGGDQT